MRQFLYITTYAIWLCFLSILISPATGIFWTVYAGSGALVAVIALIDRKYLKSTVIDIVKEDISKGGGEAVGIMDANAGGIAKIEIIGSAGMFR